MIEIELEQDFQNFPLERCCFCRNPTKYWTLDPSKTPGEQLACCEKCSKIANYNDLPTKQQWCRREDIVRKGL